MIIYLLTFAVFLPFIGSDQPPVKAGLAASSYLDIDSRVAQLDVAWVRGWQIWPGEELPSQVGGVEYIPNLWCQSYTKVTGSQVYFVDQLWIIKDLGHDYSGRLLFLNEPDMAHYGHHGQCEITVYQAALLYLYVRTQLPQVQLIGPGVSHVDYLNGWQWTRDFIEMVTLLSGEPPAMWAWDTHTYLGTEPPLAIIDSYEAMLAEYGIANQQFFVSEWAACDAARVAEMRQAFDEDGRIVGHAYYDQYGTVWDGPGRCTMLFVEGTAGPELSELGRAYTGNSYKARTGVDYLWTFPKR